MGARACAVRLAAVCVTALSLTLVPISASAVPAVVDPDCFAIFESVGVVSGDPETVPAGLPRQVTVDDMACLYTWGEVIGYVYLDDPFGKFVEMITSFAADGWVIKQLGHNDEFDVSTLPAHAADPEFKLYASLGPNIVGLTYITDARGLFEDSLLGTALFVYAEPLVESPAIAGGVDLDEPSSLSELRTIGSAIPNPLQSLVLLGTATGLTFLLGVPGFLLSAVFTSRYDQWFGWANRGRLGELRKRAAGAATDRRRWVFLGVGMVLAAVISGFVDPRFGFNAMSLRLTLTLLLSFVVFNVGAWAVITAVIKRAQPEARPSLSLHPLALVVLAVAVILSRMLGFSPGVVFGLVAGVAFAVTLALSRQALVILVGSGYAVAIAIITWVTYSALNAAGPPDDAALVALSEFFSGVTVQGVSTLPIALIPLATLDGGTLFAWRKWVWAVAYAIGLAVFLLVLFTLPGGESAIDGDFTRWIVIFAVFVAIALGVWFVDWLFRKDEKTRLVLDRTRR